MTPATIQTPTDISVPEQVLLTGDLSALSSAERVAYYLQVCKSTGLNYLTKPFEYLPLSDGKGGQKLILYARADATDQLRSSRGISVEIVNTQVLDGVFIVTARTSDASGRRGENIGAVPLVRENGQWKTSQNGKRFIEKDGTVTPLSPEERSNAMMKAYTKAARRATLQHAGLGFLDESEIESIASRPAPVEVEQQAPQIAAPAAAEPAVPKAIKPTIDAVRRFYEARDLKGLKDALGVMKTKMTGAGLDVMTYGDIAEKYAINKPGFTQASVINAILEMHQCIEDAVTAKTQEAWDDSVPTREEMKP